VARSKRACPLYFILFRVTRIGLKTAQHIRIQVESLPKKSVTKFLTADYRLISNNQKHQLESRLGIQDLFYAYSVYVIFHVCMKSLGLEASHLPFRKSLKGKG
jgi:hypothetical protein